MMLITFVIQLFLTLFVIVFFVRLTLVRLISLTPLGTAINTPK